MKINKFFIFFISFIIIYLSLSFNSNKANNQLCASDDACNKVYVADADIVDCSYCPGGKQLQFTVSNDSSYRVKVEIEYIITEKYAKHPIECKDKFSIFLKPNEIQSKEIKPSCIIIISGESYDVKTKIISCNQL
jgi:hypothetical protein